MNITSGLENQGMEFVEAAHNLGTESMCSDDYAWPK